jgi:hypothetical protein
VNLSNADEPPQRFPIRLGRKSRPILLLFGVREHNAYVDVGAGEIDAHFGFFRFRTLLANVTRWRIEGPWLWLTAIGVRRGIRRGDITFGGNHQGGVRLDFHERVPWTMFKVPTLYLTVADLEAFAQSLSASGIPGEDARKRQ